MADSWWKFAGVCVSTKVWLLAVTLFLISSTSRCDDRALVQVSAFGVYSPASTARRFGSGGSTVAAESSLSSLSSFGSQTTPRQLQLHPLSTRTGPSSRRQHKTMLYRIRCENKYYQLEEMEDRENCTTELFLKEDGQVLIGETDGPLWTEAVGHWQIRGGTDDFTMTIKRKFKSGNDGSDMGEFEYELERTYIGDMTAVGESVAVTGVMHCSDVLSGEDQEVGFFNMIDATDVREDKRSDAMPGTGVAGKVVKDASETHKGADFVSTFSQANDAYTDNGYGNNLNSYNGGWGGQDNAVYGGGDSGYSSGYGNGYQAQQQQQQQQPFQQYGNSYGSFGGGQSQQQEYHDPGPPSFAEYAYGGQQQQQPQQSEYDRQYQAQNYDQYQQPDPQQGNYDQGWSNEGNTSPQNWQEYQDNWPRYQ